MNENQMLGSIERIYRRVLLAVGRGKVTTGNDTGSVQKLQAGLSPLEVRDGTPRLAEFGFTSYPPDGSDAVALFVGGDRSEGVIVATGHQQSRPTGLSQGESMMYSQDGKQVYMTASGGIVVNANGQNVVVNDAADVTWTCTGKFKVVAPGGVEFDTPLVSSTGDIQDNSGTNEDTMADMRHDYDEHGHPVAEVESGGATIISGTPTVAM
jgi:phage baseplate assembly protein V